MSDYKYFAADEAEATARILEDKAGDWFKGLNEVNYIETVKRSWSSYHGNYYARYGARAHEINMGGENGELVNIAVNHYRNLARHMLNMVTATRPAFQCRAVNTDRKSLIQAKLGNGLLDYYMREMRLEQVLKDAVEYAIVLGAGFVKLEWNSTKGRIYDYIEPSEDSIVDYDEDENPLDENGNILKPFPVYEGDIEFSLLSPLDVFFDTTKPYFDKNDWIVTRTFINKYDLAAKYPELKDKIIKLETKDKLEKTVNRFSSGSSSETDDVAVYEFFHKRTEAMPNGRYLVYCQEDIILQDSIMPYRQLPVFRIAPSSVLGTPFGYSDMFDLLPLQQFLNSLYSTAATNINAFGVQSILSPRDAGIEVEQVSDGLQFIKYNPQAGKPEPLQLTATSPEVYNMMNLLEKTMETLSGVNAVARGNPEQSLRSGTALALVHSQALQFITGLQQSYIALLEDVGTGMINLLKDFANVPRIATITGIKNVTQMKEFKSDDIKSINRVIVDTGNALMQSTAGRAQVAENLLQMGLIDNVDKYLMVINTGNLDYLTEGKLDNLGLIKSENEALVQGETIQAIWSEKHSMHIKEHMEVLNDPELKKDPDLVQRVLDHVQQHVNLLKNVDPAILSMIGEQSIMPAPMALGPGAGTPEGAFPPDNTNSSGPVLDPNLAAPDPGQPQVPRPAGEGTILPDNLPMKPEDL